MNELYENLTSNVKFYNQLDDYQKDAVACGYRILHGNGHYPGKKGVMLFGPPGTGKTIMACALSLFQGTNALLVGRAFASPDVRKKIKKYQDEYGFFGNLDCISYQKFADRDKMPTSVLRKYDTAVFDESHVLRNWTPGYTQRLFKVKQTIPKFIFMTGTPYIKGPWDIMYCLRMCGFQKSYSTEEVSRKYFYTEFNRWKGNLERKGLKEEKQFQADISHYIVDLDNIESFKRDYNINIDVEFKLASGEFRIPKNIREETKVATENSLSKVGFINMDIIDSWRKKGPLLILFRFHETLNKYFEASNGTPIVANKSHLVKKAFKEEGDITVLSTIGLTESSYDFRQCKQVVMFDTSHSHAIDRQSYMRCFRRGDKEKLRVLYLAHQDDAVLLKSIERINLADKKLNFHASMSPSRLKILEKCPGSYWFYKTGRNLAEPRTLMNFAIAAGSEFGRLQHSIAEKYLKTPSLELPEDMAEPLKIYVETCRKRMKSACSYGIEDFVNNRKLHEEFAGTCDFWAYSKSKNLLYISDLKAGKSCVSPKNNIQLWAYSLMVYHVHLRHLKKYPRVVHSIFQAKEKQCVYEDEKDWIDAKNRIKKIIKNVLKFKNNPELGLSNNCSSPLCPAAELHKTIRR